MPKPKTIHPELPPRMVKRQWKTSKGVIKASYYYEYPRDEFGKRILESLGTDFSKAKQHWGEIEGIKVEAFNSHSLGDIYTQYMRWANNLEVSGLAIRTIKDRTNYWTQLKPVFGHINIDQFQTSWFHDYFEKRTSKAGAKKEVKFLSVIFNWAKARDKCKIENPVTGTTRQMKVPESRDILITADEFNLVYECANDMIKDLMDFMYIICSRPEEALYITFSNITIDNELLYIQEKTGQKKCLPITGSLSTIIHKRRALLKNSKVMAIDPTLLFDDKGNALSQVGNVRYQFKKARDAADKKAIELGIKHRRFQLKDIRPYSATNNFKQNGMESTRKLLGHSTENQTREYIRDYLGEQTEAMEKPNIAIMAKVSNKNGESD